MLFVQPFLGRVVPPTTHLLLPSEPVYESIGLHKQPLPKVSSQLLKVYNLGGVRFSGRVGKQYEEIPVFDLQDLETKLLRVKDDPEARMRIGQPLLESFNQYGIIRIRPPKSLSAVADQAFQSSEQALQKRRHDLDLFHIPEIASFRGLEIKIGRAHV